MVFVVLSVIRSIVCYDPVRENKFALFCGIFEDGEFKTDVNCEWRGAEYTPPIAVERTSSWYNGIKLVMDGDEVKIDGNSNNIKLYPNAGIYNKLSGNVTEYDVMVLYYSRGSIMDSEEVGKIINDDILPSFLKSVRKGYVKDENGVLQFNGN